MSAVEVFGQAVGCVLAGWPALQIAVENSFGGVLSKEKAEWLVEVTSKFIQETSYVSSADIEEYLNILMDQEFDTLIEDGSVESISQQLHDLWEKSTQGKAEEVQQFITMAKKKSGSTIPNEPSPQHKNEMCNEEDRKVEDGWTAVTGKKHKHTNV